MSLVHLVACPRPFSTAQIVRQVPAGATIAALMRDIGLNPDPIFARVFIDDRLILKAEWEYATPKAGQLVTMRVVPTGGGGGGKDALRIVAMIGVVVASIFTAGAAGAAVGGLLGVSAATGGAIAGATVSIAGSLAIGALIPPAKPKLQDLSRLNLSPALSLTGTSNQLAPYAPIPRVYGRYRMFPPLAARTFTETVGNDQYLRMLFCCGYGPLALSELKIGQTPIAQFEDVEMEIRYGYPNDPPITLFPDDVYEDALSVLLERDGGWMHRTSQLHAREIILEYYFPNGLATYFSDTQGYINNNVTFEVEYRAVGDVSWTVLDLDQPAVAATFETAYGGADNGILFTAVTPGSLGNALHVTVVEDPTRTDIRAYADDFTGLHTFVWFPPGTSTAAVINALNAAQVPPEGVPWTTLWTAANAPGHDGSGLAVAFTGQLSGGREALSPQNVAGIRLQPFYHAVTFSPPDAQLQYEVRTRAIKTSLEAAFTRIDTVYWSMLRTIQTGEPVSKPGLCLVALRIKATNQLNGTLDQFNLLAESILPDWTGSAWLARPTSNPASIYRNILQGSANARPLPDSRVDLTRLAAFHESCTAQGWSFNANIDYRSTVYELSRDVLAAGRASLHQQDGKFTVVEDLPQTLAKQLITPRNSWGFRGTRVFSDLPHALKVRFVNPEKDWQQDERIVYADGYSEANASQFEALELTGITDPEQAWKLARYHLAVATLRPETYEVNLDVEHLVCSRGDLVLVQHDVPLFGLITGRIKAVTTDSYGRATALTLDEPCVMQAGDRYGVRVRLQDNTYVQREVLNVPGSQTTLTLLSPI